MQQVANGDGGAPHFHGNGHRDVQNHIQIRVGVGLLVFGQLIQGNAVDVATKVLFLPGAVRTCIGSVIVALITLLHHGRFPLGRHGILIFIVVVGIIFVCHWSPLRLP